MQQSLFEPLDSARVFTSQPQLKSSVCKQHHTSTKRAARVGWLVSNLQMQHIDCDCCAKCSACCSLVSARSTLAKHSDVCAC
eukprot:14024-Heterococcus_DN1.PRE.3